MPSNSISHKRFHLLSQTNLEVMSKFIVVIPDAKKIRKNVGEIEPDTPKSLSLASTTLVLSAK